MELSAVRCHTLRVVNVDCRGNMKTPTFDWWASLDARLFNVAVCMQNPEWMQGRLPVLEKHCLSHQLNIFCMSPPYLTCYVIYCYLNHRTNKWLHNESP